MSYEIQSQNLNPNKVFILQKSELEKRFDPQWYVYLKSISGFKDETTKLKTLLKANPQYGANEIGIDRTSNEQPRYIRITDINEFGELFNEFGKTANNAESKYFLSENDLLIARSGNTVGKSYLHKKTNYEAFFAGYMIRFKLDETQVLPKYVFVYTQTDLYKRWTKAIQRTTGQPNINAEEYKSLELPLPEFSTQKKIVDIYFKFLENKKQNELEAERLLSSIDDYLLKALGIELPETPENTLQNRIFTTTLREVTGGRFDPRYYQSHFLSFYENIGQQYSVKNLKEITQYIGSGSTPTAGGEAYTSEIDGVPFVRITNLKNDTIDLTDILYIKREIHETTLKRTQLNSGDLLLSMAGTIGLTIIVPDFIQEANINQALARIVLKDDILNVYVKEILNSVVGKTQTNRLSRPAVQANINFEEIGSLLIPIPPIEKQKEIADHITTIRNQARQLTEKTNEAMKKANEEIEQILLQ